MAVFNLNESMKVKTLQAQFKKKYGATLRVYKGMHFADTKTMLKDLGETAHPTGRFEVGSDIKVAEFEQAFFNAYGVKVQVATPDNSALSKKRHQSSYRWQNDGEVNIKYGIFPLRFNEEDAI